MSLAEPTNITIAKQLNIPDNHVCLVGSTLICGKGNDRDYLCLMPEHLDKGYEQAVLTKQGYVMDIEQDEVSTYGELFVSWRKDNTNLLLTYERGYFMSEISIAYAAMVAFTQSNLDLSQRDDRVVFHSQIRELVSVHLE